MSKLDVAKEQIAYLMLTPGSDVSLDQFGQLIGQEALEAMTLVGQTGTLDLLRPLLKNS